MRERKRERNPENVSATFWLLQLLVNLTVYYLIKGIKHLLHSLNKLREINETTVKILPRYQETICEAVLKL